MAFDISKDEVIKDFGHININADVSLEVKLMKYNDGDTKVSVQRLMEKASGEKTILKLGRIETVALGELMIKFQEVAEYMKELVKISEKATKKAKK